MAGPEEVLALHLIDLAVLVDHAARPERQNQFITLADAGERRLAVLHAAERREHLAVRIRRLVLAVVHPCVRRLGGGSLQRERQHAKRSAVERRLDRDRARLSRLVDDELVAIADGHAGIRAVQRNDHFLRRRFCPCGHPLAVRLTEVRDMNRVCVRRDLAPGNCDRRHRPAGEFFVVLIAQLERRARRLRVVALDLEGDPFARLCYPVNGGTRTNFAPDICLQVSANLHRAGLSSDCNAPNGIARCDLLGAGRIRIKLQFRRCLSHGHTILVVCLGIQRNKLIRGCAAIRRCFIRPRKIHGIAAILCKAGHRERRILLADSKGQLHSGSELFAIRGRDRQLVSLVLLGCRRKGEHIALLEGNALIPIHRDRQAGHINKALFCDELHILREVIIARGFAAGRKTRLRRGGEGRLGQNDSREFGVLRDDNDCAGIQDRIISRFGNRPPSFRIHNREQGFLLYVWVLCHIDLICARRRIRRCCHLHITQRKIRRRKRIVIAQPRK